MRRALTVLVVALLTIVQATPAYADAVPDVTGLTTAEATTLLKQAGFKVKVEHRDGKPGDLIFAQEPLAYAARPAGTTIVIRTGQPASTARSAIGNVPTFIGLPAADARERMKTWQGAVEESSLVLPKLVGKVVHQWPDAGEVIPPGDHLIVVVGVASMPSDRHKTVPTLEGRDVTAARKLADDQGFSLTVEEIDLADHDPIIVAQFPLPGSLSEAGTAIRVRVPRGTPRPAVPPTAVPPTAIPPTAIPPTEVPPTAVPPTDVPTPETRQVPPTAPENATSGDATPDVPSTPPDSPPDAPPTAAALRAPILTLPADRDTFRAMSVGFDWHGSTASGVRYEVRIERQTDGGTWTHQRTVTTATLALRSILLQRGRYRWSARARQGDQSGPWALPRGFYVYGDRK